MRYMMRLMTYPSFDAVVVGLGAMGSATIHALAKRGLRVLGLDLFTPPHQKGSTHGRTRIIREAYYEHPLYVPLVQQAYRAWSDLERESGRALFLRTGGMMLGPPEGELVAGARSSAERHGLPHELLDAPRIRELFPAFAPEEDMIGLLEPRAGLLLPELCVESLLELARASGAVLRFGECFERWDAAGEHLRVTTDAGRYQTRKVVLAMGPWMPGQLAGLELPLEVERQLFHWFEPRSRPELFEPARCPITLWEYAPGRMFAGFPDLGDGFKAGIHHEGEITDPASVRRAITDEDTGSIRALLERYLPDANGRLREARVCLYTNTPDHHFLIDAHPEEARVILASPCSGHGFKFASAIGELVAALVMDEAPRFDLSPFAVERFRGARP
ncbi:MAG: N-methyl-L-tryptophan oxidase [Gemmatimonadota bacterium]|nr:N-methyl-L-tryptophan oxidase [Gemmatimonadota bacterium]